MHEIERKRLKYKTPKRTTCINAMNLKIFNIYILDLAFINSLVMRSLV